MSRVAISTIGIMLITILSKILGFARELVLASAYGTSMYSDIYLISMNIPNVIFDSIAVAISTTFIPLYFKNDSEGGQIKSLQFTNNIYNLTIVISIILTILGILFTKPLVKIFAVGFEGEKLSIAVDFTRILMLSMMSIGLASILKSYLNAKDEFIKPTLMMSLPFNIIVIVSIILSIKTSPYVLAYGTLIAIFSKFLFQLPYAKNYGYKYKKYLNFKDESIKKLIWLVWPVFIGVAVNQINTMVDRTLASTLTEGSISALNYANRLNNFVMGLVISSIGSVIYPVFSKLSSQNDEYKLKKCIVSSVNTVILLVTPISVGAIVLSNPIVKILFERGAFDSNATNMTSVALMYYSIGLIGFGLRDILGKIFYSLEDTKTPMLNAAISMVINILLNIVLVKSMGHGGLALATSLSALICILLLFISLKNKIGNFNQSEIINTGIKSVFASVIMGVVIKYFYSRSYGVLGTGLFYDVLNLTISIIIGILLYLILVISLNINEVSSLINFIKKKFKILN